MPSLVCIMKDLTEVGLGDICSAGGGVFAGFR